MIWKTSSASPVDKEKNDETGKWLTTRERYRPGFKGVKPDVKDLSARKLRHRTKIPEEKKKKKQQRRAAKAAPGAPRGGKEAPIQT